MYVWEKYKYCSLDQIVKYYPVVKYLRKYKLQNKKILEIGCGDFGITQFYPIRITGVDIKFSNPNLKLITPIQSSVTLLPFMDQSFDVVICMDLIEHISSQERVAAIKEMVRVVKKVLVIGFPCGKISEKYERKFNYVYKKKLGSDHPWIKEHFSFGLPQEGEILEIIRDVCQRNKREIHLIIKKNMNIILWYLSRIANLPYNYFLLPLRGRIALATIFIWRYFNFGSCYRKIFYIEFI